MVQITSRMILGSSLGSNVRSAFALQKTMAEGASNALAPAMPVLFSRQVQPAYICLPSAKWSGWQELHLRPPRSERGRLLLTLHPEIGCQGWTRTNTERCNRPPCYFDTTWQWSCRRDSHPHRSA